MHVLTVDESVRSLAVIAGWITAIVVALGLARGGRVAVLESVAVAGGIGLGWYLSAGTRYAVFVPPVAIDALLLWFFGRTLLPGREPLVTSIARFVRGELAPEIERYTRRVTWAWCAFFAGLAAVSLALAAFAPLAVWSLFANALVLPLVAIMFAGEYGYRRWRFPGYTHLSPVALLRRLVRGGYFGSAPSAK